MSKNKKEPERRPFTSRQKQYKINRLEGMNQYNAARAAGYSETYSRQACRVEKLAKTSIQDALERAGVTEKFVSEILRQQLKATTLKVANGEAYEVKDNAAVSKAVELASKLRGWQQPVIVKGEIEHSGNIKFFEELVKKAGINDGE